MENNESEQLKEKLVEMINTNYINMMVSNFNCDVFASKEYTFKFENTCSIYKDLLGYDYYIENHNIINEKMIELYSKNHIITEEDKIELTKLLYIQP